MRTILLVEDDPDSLAQAVVELAGEGFLVRSAAGEEEALATLDDGPVDLVVIDPALGGSTGFGLMRRLIARFPKTPIVIHSSDPGLQENFACWIADRFVLKWGEPQGLRGAVREALELRAA